MYIAQSGTNCGNAQPTDFPLIMLTPIAELLWNPWDLQVCRS